MKSHFEVLEVVVPSETDFPAEGMVYTKAGGIKLGLLGTARVFHDWSVRCLWGVAKIKLGRKASVWRPGALCHVEESEKHLGSVLGSLKV